MKTVLKITGIFVFMFLSFHSCTVEIAKPTVRGSAITNITSFSATANGEVTTDGGNWVTAAGVCWSATNTTPTTSDSKTNDHLGFGEFTSNISGLKPQTTYYVRYYATNTFGTGYSGAISFKTLLDTPTK